MKNILFIIIFFLSQHIYSQQKIELRFIKYLIAKEEYNAALNCINTNLEIYKNHSSSIIDSLNYLKGWCYYNQKKLNNSITFLNKVNKASSLYSKSKVFSIYNNLHMGQHTEAQEIIKLFTPKDQKDSIMTSLLLCGKSLLNRNYSEYKINRKNIDSSYYGIQKELITLDKINNELLNHKQKSPTLAAIMSALIPGSGKIYLGKTGQGISSFLIVTGLGLVTMENIIKRGPSKFPTILFATTFTTFYIGNIYGTIKLTTLTNKEFNKYQNAKILFNIHIPLRNLYN